MSDPSFAERLLALEFILPFALLPPRFTNWSVIVGVVLMGVAFWLASAGVRAFRRADTRLIRIRSDRSCL